jgi:hypothetical protein
MTAAERARIYEAAIDAEQNMDEATRAKKALAWIESDHLTETQFIAHLTEEAFQRLCREAEENRAEAA